jgi:hypothetical protein
MSLPFTLEQFLTVFEAYNHSIWPFQFVLNLLAAGVLALTLKPLNSSNTVIAAVLAFFWAWIGIAYHFAFFRAINPAAYVFAIFNVVQGVVFFYYGVFKHQLSFRYQTNIFGIIGALFIAYSLILYPLLGYSLGHVYPKSPTFGLPCPTTIFTFGILLWTNAKIPKVVLIIPLLWSLIGFSAALTLGIREDIGLLVAGVVGMALIMIRDKHAVESSPDSKPAV